MMACVSSLLRSLCVLNVFTQVVGPLAPTWSSCNCRWDNWSAWSTCSRTCGGGQQHRDRSVWSHDIPACEGFEKCASSDMGIQRQACNTNCFHNGTYRHFSFVGFCSCAKGTTGHCCEQIVDCGKPSEVSNGKYENSRNSTSYGSVIRLICNQDYNLTDISLATRTCTEYGYWTGRNPECLYSTSCKSFPCQNGATCTNTIGDYVCHCMPGWTGKNCETDVQPPLVEGCPDHFEIFTSEMTSFQNWTAPRFYDPFGNIVIITTNYPSSEFTFPWGEFVVTYTGVKQNNGMQAECLFNVVIKPIPCARLTIPKNGYVVCNGWREDYTQVCKKLCLAGFSPPPGYSDDIWYNCGATGLWLPALLDIDCLADVMTIVDAPASNAPTFSNCSSKDEELHVQQFYIDQLKKSAFNSLCEDYLTECDPQNVHVFC